MPRLNWRWLLALSAGPSFALLLFYRLVPESPRYLCLKGRAAHAHQILEKMALVNQKELPLGMLVSYETIKVDEENPSEHTSVVSVAREKISSFRSSFSSFFMLFSSNLIGTTLLLWVLFFGNTFVYYGIVLLTSELSTVRRKCDYTSLQTENLGEDSLYTDVLVTSFAGPVYLMSTFLFSVMTLVLQWIGVACYLH